MIRYEQFDFAAPPRTGTTWFLDAATRIGLGEKSKFAIHKLFPEKERHVQRMYISMVRHPVDWLMSYYHEIHPGSIQVDVVDIFQGIQANDPCEFMEKVVDQIPGSVGSMFSAYKADSVLRLEDLPWCALSLFETVGVKQRVAQMCNVLPKQNVSQKHFNIPDVLRRRVMESEADFCERYDYLC